MNYSPILIQVYNRKQHFTACVESLAQCPEARYTTLFISSDQGKDDKAKEAVAQIRQYCQNITGFAHVELLAWEPNLGGEKAYFQSVDRVFEQFDRFIYTEDDNIFAPNFLSYINQGLEFYQNDTRIFSICGYKHGFVMPKSYSKSAFATPILSAWGIAHWRDKYKKVNFHPKGNYWQERKKWGNHMTIGWSELMERVLTTGVVLGDAIMELHCLENKMINIMPRISLVKNTGYDGSGTNCNNNLLFQQQQLAQGDEVFIFETNPAVDQEIFSRQKNAIDFPFVSQKKLLYLKNKRIAIKRLRDVIEQYPRVKKFIKRLL